MAFTKTGSPPALPWASAWAPPRPGASASRWRRLRTERHDDFRPLSRRGHASAAGGDPPPLHLPRVLAVGRSGRASELAEPPPPVFPQPLQPVLAHGQGSRGAGWLGHPPLARGRAPPGGPPVRGP